MNSLFEKDSCGKCRINLKENNNEQFKIVFENDEPDLICMLNLDEKAYLQDKIFENIRSCSQFLND